MNLVGLQHRALVIVMGLGVAGGVVAEDAVSPAKKAPARTPLLAELGDLNSDAMPTTAATEKFYVVQDRTIGLGRRVEVALGGARNFNSNIYVRSYETSLRAIYHVNNRWFVDAGGSKVFNDLTDSGQHAWAADGIYPDTSYVKQRFDAVVGFNAIYGKARLTQDSVFYFDQYIALGGGQVLQDNGIEESRVASFVGDIGLAVWVGRRLSFRVGAKDHFFEERRVASQSKVHHLLGYSSVGVLL